MKEEHNHYFKPCPYDTLDVYRVISIFGVTDPCIQHALKKLLCSGVRGHKDQSKDIQDVIDTLERWKQMRCEDNKVENKPPTKFSESVADNTSPLKPWVPDDSGEWIETSEIDFHEERKVLSGKKLEVLADFERNLEQEYKPTVGTFEFWFGRRSDRSDWGNRIAYKVCKD